MTSDTRPLVWVLGTGGTIAQWGSTRLTFVEYGGGERLDVHQNLERIPEAQQFVRTKAEHLWHVGSGIKTMVVATNRNGAGQMIRSSRQRELGVIAGDNLSAHKARILLRLALTKTQDPEEIQRMYDTY